MPAVLCPAAAAAPPPQRETNCKIAIRGRGSVKEGISKDPKYDYGEDEELHVLVTGETQEDVSGACGLGGARGGCPAHTCPDPS